MTNAYAVHFAQQATESDEQLAIIEVNTDKLNPFSLIPDEDFLEQATRELEQFKCAGTDMHARTKWFRKRALTEFQHLWDKSIEHLGTCAYVGTVPITAITRVAKLPSACHLAFASDPIIALMNYKLLGNYYRDLIRHVFGDETRESHPPFGLDASQYSREDVEVIKGPGSASAD